MFLNSSFPDRKYSDLKFLIVDSISSGFLNYAGLSSDDGIILTRDQLSLSKEDRNVIHHELMHHIQRYYANRYLIRIALNNSDYHYLNNRPLNRMEYYKVQKFESFSVANVLNRMDYGMTSLYSGMNHKEHLAELWADLLTDYDFYHEEIEKHPAFEENVTQLITYLNEILVTVGGETLDGVDDILRFDPLTVESTSEAFDTLEYYLKASDFEGSEVELYPNPIYLRYKEIKATINTNIMDQFEWYYDYSSEYPAFEIPYHENFGVTEEEYNLYNSIEDYMTFTEANSVNGSFKDLGDGKLRLECEDLDYLNGLVFDLNQNTITGQYGEFSYDYQIESSDRQDYSGYWNGGGWACIFDHKPVIEDYEEGITYGKYTLSIGRFEESNDLILWFKNDTFKDGHDDHQYEILVIKSE